MPGPETHASARDPGGILGPYSFPRPGVLLRRLRPVGLAAVVRQMQHYSRTVRAAQLMETHFPDGLAAYRPVLEVGWWEVLIDLGHKIEEDGWFELDWELLDLAWAGWMEDRENDAGDALARFLEYIPVQLYGLTGAHYRQYPAMEMGHILLAETPAIKPSPHLLAAAELYNRLDKWRRSNRAAAWERLQAIEVDPGRYPEPVRWLPELARWAVKRTGNFILDRSFDPNSGPWVPWTDIEQVKVAWRRAGPVIEQFHRLNQWVTADESRLTLLAYALMEGNHYDKLEW